jgi:hypothetical protein
VLEEHETHCVCQLMVYLSALGIYVRWSLNNTCCAFWEAICTA